MTDTIKNIKEISRKLRSYVEILFFMLSPHVSRSLLLCTNCFYKHSTVLFHTITSCYGDFSKYADFFLYNLVKCICGISCTKRNIDRVAIVYLISSSRWRRPNRDRSNKFEHFSIRRDLFSIRQESQNYVHRFLNPKNPVTGKRKKKKSWSSGKSMTHAPFVETVFLICCLVVHCTPRRLPQNW